MPQIAFFIELQNSKKNIKGMNLDEGNPGVGGTQYLFLLTVKELNKLYGEGYSILLTNICLSNDELNLKSAHVEDEKEAIKYCENNGISNLVFNANVADRVSLNVFDTSINIILWAHNTLNAKRQKIAAETKSIKWVVCVSESQFKNMKDTPCFEKCSYINNIIPEYFYDEAILTDYSEEKVVYVGSLMPQKGAHNLLEIWKYVEEKCPSAQLYILGGANVWNSNEVQESVRAADPYYDRVLKKRLNKLSHPENIHFMGAHGWKFIDSFISTFRLGVVNPSHYMRDETFCLSAIEMATHGLPIISRQRQDGLNTTIIHGKTGFLEKKDRDIANQIISIVSSKQKSKIMGEAGREYAERFVANKVVSKWHELIEGKNDVESQRKKTFLPKDSLLLKKDCLLKIGFVIESGKAISLIKKKLKIVK